MEEFFARANRFARAKHLINRQAKEQEAKELDERQFSQRVRACEQKLYNTARMLLPCQADCEDAVQEALFKAWARLDSLRDTGRFEAWLMRILINECKMLLRRRRAHRESALTGAEEDFRVPDAPPGAEEMRAALRALEEKKYRLPLLLHLRWWRWRECCGFHRERSNGAYTGGGNCCAPHWNRRCGYEQEG